MATQSITLRTFDGSTREDSLTIEEFSRAQTLRRALSKTSIVLGITFLTVFVPGLHLISVPLGLFISIILFIKTSRATQVVQATKLTCPACQQSMGIMRRTLAFPFKELCEHCHREVIVNQA